MSKRGQLLCLLLLVGMAGCSKPSALPILNSPDTLRAYFNSARQKISAHRGGPSAGFPENCIETFARTIASVPAIIECDVVLTKDSVMVMMHDRTLERTSTGTGLVAAHNWNELTAFYLKDTDGVVTPYHIPTLEQVLLWSKDRVPLTLDVRREVPPAMVVEMLHRLKIFNAAVITYNANEAKVYHELDSTLMISCSIRTVDDYLRLRDAGVKDAQMIAFVGVTEPDQELYLFLHERGIGCILGVLGNLDRRAQARGDHLYKEWVHRGADILATDRPFEAYAAIKEKK